MKIWELNIGPTIIGGEVHEVHWLLLHSYIGCFVLNLKELGQLKKQTNCVILEDDNLNFKQPYKLNEVERALLQTRTLESLEAGLVELFKDEYVSIIMMPTKNNIFGSWIECYLCGNYTLVNKHMQSNKYAMLLLDKIFDALG
jgi:hypothetical protein